jgi:hypothetical protein
VEEEKMISLGDRKRGAASFYIVAISTLILVIVVASFATLIVSQMERTSNADLSQSAYDAAMAGVEDAKLAYLNYKNCKAAGYTAASSDYTGEGLPPGKGEACSYILHYMEQSGCDMVAKMLGRTVTPNVGIEVEEDGNGNNMQQYYTCVKINNQPQEQTKNLQPYETAVFKPVFASGSASEIKKIKVRWSGNSNLSVTILQAPSGFNFDDFTFPSLVGDKETGTNLGTVFLTRDGVGTDSSTILGDVVMKSNDKTVQNIRNNVSSNENNDMYKYEAIIELPAVYNGSDSVKKADGLFEIAIMSFDSGSNNGESVSISYLKDGDKPVSIENQFVVDSTGRANDLYKRVKVTLDAEGQGDLVIGGPLILGDGGLVKNFSVTTE